MDTECRQSIKQGSKLALPLILGYLPVAIAFGILSKNIGISFGETSLFSIMVFAGASQFMALDLIQGGVATSSIILATFLLNLRHMMMSAALSTRLENIKTRHLPLIAFGITDESFSVLSFTQDKLNLPFILAINILSYMSWVFGTVMGYLVGEVLPASLQSSLGIGLYGMFAALLFPQFKGNRKNLMLAIIGGVIYTILFYSKIFTSGWDIIVSIILSSAAGVILFTEEKEE